MIKVEKQVTITVSGDDVKTLSDVCELARRYMASRLHPSSGSYSIDEFDLRETQAIQNLLGKIFDA